jgi:hypothetical protein
VVVGGEGEETRLNRKCSSDVALARPSQRQMSVWHGTALDQRRTRPTASQKLLGHPRLHLQLA